MKQSNKCFAVNLMYNSAVGATDILRVFNPWWNSDRLPAGHAFERRRMLYQQVERIALDPEMRLTSVIHGPRRVGKTVMLQQLVGQAVSSGAFPPRNVCYASMQHKALRRLSPTELVGQFKRDADPGRPALVVLDEIQFVLDWEQELKELTDLECGFKFVVSGSAMSELKRKSVEAGTGRFYRFYLPPLLFCEFLDFRGKWPGGLPRDAGQARAARLEPEEVLALNEDFIDYVNYGAFPALVLDPKHRSGRKEYVELHMPDEDLFSSLPAIYGISNADGLYDVFEHVAKHNCQELSLGSINRQTGIQLNTIYKYLKYLEACLLIRKIPKLGSALRALQRDSFHKFHLVNPNMHGLLNYPVTPDDPDAGHAIEAAVFSQYCQSFHGSAASGKRVFYCRYRHDGTDYEVDMVVTPRGTAYLHRLCEVKWSDKWDRLSRSATTMAHIRERKRKAASYDGCWCTTRTAYGEDCDKEVRFLPTAQFAVALGLESMERAE